MSCDGSVLHPPGQYGVYELGGGRQGEKGEAPAFIAWPESYDKIQCDLWKLGTVYWFFQGSTGYRWLDSHPTHEHSLGRIMPKRNCCPSQMTRRFRAVQGRQEKPG